MAGLTDEQKNDKRLEKNKKKLIRTITKAGLSWASFSSIIEVSDEINGHPFPEGAHAVWVYNTITKREQIILPNRTIEDFKTKEIELIIKHEMLHKSMYRNINGATNESLINVALDAVIQKILYLSHRKSMMELCEKAYNVDRTSYLAICNSSITKEERNKLQKAVKKIFDSLYMTTRDDNFYIASDFIGNNPMIENKEVPDPLSTYIKLSNLLTKEQKEQIENESVSKKCGGENEDSEDKESKGEEAEGEEEKEEKDDGKNADDGDEKEKEEEEEGDKEGKDGKEEDKKEDKKEGKAKGNGSAKEGGNLLIHGGAKGKRANPKNDEQAEKEVAKLINNQLGGGYCSIGKAVGELLDKYVINPSSCNTEEIKDFVSTWYTLKQVEGAEQSIYAEIQSAIRFDPYPQNLSRTGIELIALGVSDPDEMPLYMNVSDTNTCKKKIKAYVDTSPSMRNALPHVMHVLDFFDSLEECEYANDEFNGKYFFANNVKGASEEEWEKFKQGSYYGGYGTSFEAVVRHIIENKDDRESDIVLIMTDGESSVSDALAEEFNMTGMKAYVMYFLDKNAYRYSFQNTRGHSSLDELNGESFSINYQDERR